MGQRFDLKDTRIAPCQNLHVIKQFEDESIDAFLQRIMNVATDGYGMANNDTLQHVAAEAFLSGCRNDSFEWRPDKHSVGLSKN